MNQNKSLLITLIGILTLLLTVVGATFAYFQAQSTDNVNIDAGVNTGTTDNLSFKMGDGINIFATEENFGSGMGNLTDITTSTAILQANNTSNEAAANYNLYFVIDSNDFEYTTESNTAELLMKVYAPDGEEVTEIPGIHYVTVDTGDVSLSGFDITTSYGAFCIAEAYEIIASPLTNQEWQIEVTFVNLNSDQNANTNKSFSGSIYMTEEHIDTYTLPIVNTIETTLNNGLELEVNAKITNGTANIESYYFAIMESNAEVNTFTNSEIEYIKTNSSTYKFDDLKGNTNYRVLVYVEDENKFNSPVYEQIVLTNEYTLATVDSVTLTNVTEKSFRVNVTATAGGGTITNYYYSIDNGKTFETSQSNYYEFNNLTPGTQYFIQVYVEDVNGKKSNVYDIIGKTDYINPQVTGVVASDVTETSVKLTATINQGSSNVAKYYFSNDNGSSWVTSDNNYYVFEGLEPGTSYNFVVYVTDTLNYKSNEYTLKASTESRFYYPSVISAYGFYEVDYTNYFERYYIVNDDGTVTRYQDWSWDISGASNGYVTLQGPSNVAAVAAYGASNLYTLTNDGEVYLYTCDWRTESCTGNKVTNFGDDVIQITSYNFYDYDYKDNFPRVYALKADGTVMRYQDWSWSINGASNGYVTLSGISNAKYIAAYNTSNLYVLTTDNKLMYYTCDWRTESCTGSEVTHFGDDVIQFSTYNYQEEGYEAQFPRIVVLKADGTVMRYQDWSWDISGASNGYVTLSGISDVKYVVAYNASTVLAITNDNKLMQYICNWQETTCTGSEINY